MLKNNSNFKTLRAGMKIPEFSTLSITGQKIESSSLGDEYVLLVFLRYAGCPWCNLAIHRLTLEYQTFKDNNCEVIAFIESEPENVKKYILDRHKVTPMFPIIADSDGVIYQKFKVQAKFSSAVKSITKIPQWVHAVREHGFKQGTLDGNKFTVPAYFLVNGPTQEVIKADYGSSFYDHDTFVDLYETVFFKSY